jgi:acetyl-CoA acetyltransferase
MHCHKGDVLVAALVALERLIYRLSTVTVLQCVRCACVMSRRCHLTTCRGMKSWDFVAVDPFEDLLLGPAFAVARVLDAAGLTLKDIDVFEIHEAFAGQVSDCSLWQAPVICE